MREFLASERCDGCGAAASYAANKAGFAELLFCQHHYRAHRLALLSDYWLIDSDKELTGHPEPALTE